MDLSSKLSNIKNHLLDLAIRGKLVEQRPEEGTAEELYTQIQEEKKKLIAEGKIKKEKSLPEITEEDIPFEIPENWKWARWGNISQKIQYGLNASALAKGTVKFVRISDIHDNYVDWDNVPYCDASTEEISSYELKKNDILFARTGGTVGKSYLVGDIPEQAVFAGYLIRTQYGNMLEPYFLKFFMESSLYWAQLRNGVIATAQPNCNGQTLSKMLVPLPPLAEQKRIVAKLESYLAVIDKAEALIDKKANLDEEIRNKILDLAIRGKLVEQRPEEGTADELYAQIQEEKKKLIADGKIKKEKPLPEITDEEIPFDIPESWKWARIGQIYTLQAGTNIKADLIQDTPSEKCQYKCYGGNGIRGYVSNYNHNGNFPIIGRQGALCGNIKHASGYFYATEHAVCVSTFSNTSVKLTCFFLKVLNLNQYSTSTAQPGISVEKINKVLVPLPPLAEQKRIVAKIEELLPYCEKLK